MVTLYLSGNHIIALVGKNTGRKLTAQKLYSYRFKEPMLVDRKFVDMDKYREEVAKFWDKHKLPSHNINLILTSSLFISKMVELPIMKPKELMEYIPREFNDVENRKEPIYGCSVVNTVFKMEEGGKGKKYQHIFATMIEREPLDDVMLMMKKLHIKINSITMDLGNNIKLISKFPQVVHKTCLVQIMQGDTMSNILYVYGNYMYSTTSRLFSEVDTPGYGVEIARSVSNIIQFAKAQQISETIDNVYVAGISPDTFTYVDEGIFQINSNIQTDWLDGTGVVDWKITDSDLTDNISLLAGLQSVDDKTGIRRQYYKHSPRGIAMMKNLRSWAAVIVVSVIILIILAVLGVQYYNSTSSIKLSNQYLENQLVIDQKAEYEELGTENTALQNEITYIEQTRDALASYPVGNTYVLDELKKCAKGYATVQVSSFDQNSGLITTEVTAENVDKINQLITRLIGNHTFSNIEYTGYTYSDQTNMWTVNVICTLAPSAGRE